MSVHQVVAEVVANEELIEGHRVLVCRAPEIASEAQPGHFVNVMGSETYESILRKPFSIYRAESNGEISLLYQVRGATTLGMARRRRYDSIDLVGPLGARLFHEDPRPDAMYVLVGGGYGVPPLVFFAERLRSRRPEARIVFVLGARSAQLLLCESELIALDVELHVSTEDGSKGQQGRVTDVLADLIGPQVHVLCCGPTPMMRAVGELCGSEGVPCQVSVEVAMPCGVGVCMGCVLDLTDGRRVRTCVDGPVFEASEVVWR